MKNVPNIITKLKDKGSRITVARKMIVEVFEQRHLPMTELEIRELLLKKGRKVNKTTVYRELERLLSQKIIKAVEFGDGKKRFELDSGHHHHLVCTACHRIDEIAVDNDVAFIERQVAKNKHFKITKHTLEFFGICSNCNN